MLNQVQLIGRLGRDPEVVTAQNGTQIAKFPLATTETWTDRNSGQRQEKTEWHRLVLFGKTAEIAARYLKKGDLAYFAGKLQTQEWEKDGIKRYTTEIIVNELKMLGGNNSPGGGQQPQGAQRQPAAQQQSQQAQRPQPKAQQPAAPYDDFEADDIPF